MDKPLSIGVPKEFRIEFVDCWQPLPSEDLSPHLSETPGEHDCMPNRLAAYGDLALPKGLRS